MANDTATLVLKGKVALDDFAEAISGFIELMNSLTAEVAHGATIEWVIEGLDASSAHTTIRGRTVNNDDVVVDRVVSAYYDVGERIRTGADVPFSSGVRNAANRITGVMNGRITAVVFETARGEALVPSPDMPRLAETEKPRLAQVCHGAIRGRVQSLTNRKGLRFTLYDLVHDSAVACYLKEGSEDLMRKAWGKLALVEGIIHRDPFTGQPMSVRQVSELVVIPDTTGNWRDAIGAAKGRPGGLSPEEAIRKVRDG